MRAVLIPTWIMVATAIVIIAATAVILFGVVPGIIRFQELEECDRTLGTPSYDFETCGNM